MRQSPYLDRGAGRERRIVCEYRRVEELVDIGDDVVVLTRSARCCASSARSFDGLRVCVGCCCGGCEIKMSDCVSAQHVRIQDAVRARVETAFWAGFWSRSWLLCCSSMAIAVALPFSKMPADVAKEANMHTPFRVGRLTRRRLLQVGAVGFAGASIGCCPCVALGYDPLCNRRRHRSDEMETIIYLDYLKENVLKNYGKSYTWK